MGYWIVKTEPSAYSYADLEREGTTSWDGVKNPVAMKHLRAMQAGDDGLGYHTGGEKAGVGLAKVTALDAKLGVAKLKAGRPMARPATLAGGKAGTMVSGFGLVGVGRVA